MALEFAAKIRRLPTYPAAQGYGTTAPVARLASNESPDPPHPEVVAAISDALAGINRYPDPTGTRLRTRLSERTGVPVARIALGNGSCDLLMAIGEALLEPGAELVYAWPSFSVYPHLPAVTGARAIEVPLDAQERHDLDAMAREITAATRLAIVCNPNNPTSTALPLDQVAAFLDGVPRHVCVVLDEAYIEYALTQDTGDSIELLDKHPNLVLLRTFSKVHGLAGLRVGYGLCGSDELPRAVTQVRQPFFCNAAAQAAALAALGHDDEVTRRVERAVAERLELAERLRELGLWVAESQANFVWHSLGEDREEAAIVRGLAERGVLVREGASLGREGFLRVTVGRQDENLRFLNALSELL